MMGKYWNKTMQADNAGYVLQINRQGIKRAVLGCLLLVLGSISCNTGAGNASASPTTETTKPPIAAQTLLPSKTPAPSLTPTLSPTPVCLEQHGHLEQGEYTSSLLREQVPYLIYLPPCYPVANRQYPVLYLLHGFPFDETHWYDLGFTEWVDRAISTGILPEFLMIMPRAPEPLFTSSDGGPDSYEVEFIEDLLPAIEQNYPVDSIPQARALAGISRGGVWALEIAFRHADVFDTVIALSPALNLNYARPAYDPFLLASDDRPLPSAIFLSAGKGEPSFRQATEKLVSVLEQQEIPHTYITSQGGHDREGWILVFDNIVEFLSEAWQK